MEAEDGGEIVVLTVAALGSAAAGCIFGLIERGFFSAACKSVTGFLESFSWRQGGGKIAKDSAAAASPLPPPAPVAVRKVVTQTKLKVATSVAKAQPVPKHRLELATLKGHGDAIKGLAFTTSGHGIATACADRVVRVFKLEDVFNKSQQCLRLNVPTGSVPTGLGFGIGAAQIVVATEDMSGAGLLMFGAVASKEAALSKQQGKNPIPEIKWRKEKIHDKKNVITCEGACCDYGSGNGSFIVATCSEGTDIKVWSVEDGRCLGSVDTNQLQNTMATISPNGRFLTAAAFTADVKVNFDVSVFLFFRTGLARQVWEIVYGKDGQVRDIVKVMMLKGHKSAVTWACFSWDSERIITASKDGTIRIWNINVRYQMDEDPKCLKTFWIVNGVGQYDRIAISPDNKILAATKGATLTWLSAEDGRVVETATNAHEGEITCIAWAPRALATDQGKVLAFATGSTDKRVKLWCGVL